MRRIFFLLVVSIVLPWSAQAQRELLPPRDLDIVREKWPDAERLSTGLWSEIMRPSNGAKPQRGDHQPRQKEQATGQKARYGEHR